MTLFFLAFYLQYTLTFLYTRHRPHVRLSDQMPDRMRECMPCKKWQEICRNRGRLVCHGRWGHLCHSLWLLGAWNCPRAVLELDAETALSAGSYCPPHSKPIQIPRGIVYPIPKILGVQPPACPCLAIPALLSVSIFPSSHHYFWIGRRTSRTKVQKYYYFGRLVKPLARYISLHIHIRSIHLSHVKAIKSKAIYSCTVHVFPPSSPKSAWRRRRRFVVHHESLVFSERDTGGTSLSNFGVKRKPAIEKNNMGPNVCFCWLKLTKTSWFWLQPAGSLCSIGPNSLEIVLRCSLGRPNR